MCFLRKECKTFWYKGKMLYLSQKFIHLIVRFVMRRVYMFYIHTLQRDGGVIGFCG